MTAAKKNHKEPKHNDILTSYITLEEVQHPSAERHAGGKPYPPAWARKQKCNKEQAQQAAALSNRAKRKQKQLKTGALSAKKPQYVQLGGAEKRIPSRPNQNNVLRAVVVAARIGKQKSGTAEIVPPPLLLQQAAAAVKQPHQVRTYTPNRRPA